VLGRRKQDGVRGTDALAEGTPRLRRRDVDVLVVVGEVSDLDDLELERGLRERGERQRDLARQRLAAKAPYDHGDVSGWHPGENSRRARVDHARSSNPSRAAESSHALPRDRGADTISRLSPSSPGGRARAWRMTEPNASDPSSSRRTSSIG